MRRCRQYPQLAGRDEVLRAAIESEFQALHARLAPRFLSDERSVTHLDIACLALATHKALLPFLRDEQVGLGRRGCGAPGALAAVLQCCNMLAAAMRPALCWVEAGAAQEA